MASLSCPRCAAFRTRSTPTTAFRARTPRPNRPRTLLSVTASTSPLTQLAPAGCRILVFCPLLGQLREDGHDPVCLLRRNPWQAQKIFSLEIDDVVQRSETRLLQDRDRSRRQPFDLRQLHV